MNKLKLLPIIAIILACLLAPDAHATNHSPPSPVVLPMQQQDDQARPAQLGENQGDVPEGGSEIWTYEGQAGDILTIKAEADKPANEADSEERLQAGLLDMMLIVYTPDGTIIAKADDIQPGTVTDSVIEGLQLPTDGMYKIEVLGLEKKLSGAYTLTLQVANATLPEATPTINPDWPTLTIENELEEPICYVYISSISSDSWGADWLAEEVISPNDSHRWHVKSDIYDILLSDCYGNTLDQRESFDVINSSTLEVWPLDGPAAQCAEGLQLAHEGKLREALLLLEAGFAKRENATFTDPDEEGVCVLELGFLHYNFGNSSRALNAFQVALDIFQTSGNREKEGTTLNNIGAIYYHMGKYQQALEEYKQALQIFREMEDRAAEGDTLNNIGLIYDNQGKYNEALEEYEQALQILREVGNRATEGTTLHNIGLVYENQGKYNEALDKYKQALQISREEEDRAGEGITIINIGLIYDNQGKYNEALKEYEQALQIFREEGIRAGEGVTLNHIGVVYENQGKYDQALEQYEQALQIRREVGDRVGEGATLHNIGAVYDNQGKYDQALEKYEQALLISREVGDRAGKGTTTNNIGLVYYNQGKYDQALEKYQQALSIIRQVGDQAGEGLTLNNIGAVYHLQGKFSEALLYYEEAIGILESVRAIAGGDQERASFIAQYAGTYYRAINLYHQQGQEEDAFYTSERGRARSFLDSLATEYVQLSDEELQALIDEEGKAYFKREAAQDTLIRARVQNPPDEELVAGLEAQLEALDTAYSKALTAIEARGDELAALVPGRSTVPTLAEVQALLDEETTLLSYWVLGEEDGTLAFVIIIMPFRVRRMS